MGRFINADAYASTGQGILGNNMFAYCNNNPLCHTDPCGYSSQISFSDKEDILTMPWEDSMGSGGIYVAQGYAIFSGMKYAKEDDWRTFYSAAAQMIESGSISDAREALKQLNQNEVYKYAKAGTKVRGGIKQVKTAVLIFIAPDPTPTDEILSTQLLGYGIFNIALGVFQIIERMLIE